MLKPHLKKELGVLEVTLAGVGIILGAGIYALIGKAAAIAGTGVWLSFLIAAAIAALTGLSYAELSSSFPKAGAEYVYTNQAFGRRTAFVIAWLLILGGIIAASTVALGFGGYLEALTGSPQLLGAGIVITLASFLLFYGVKESATAAIIGTLVEAGGLILIVFVGLPYLGSIDFFEITDFSGVFSAAALIFFAYIGFEEISRMAEETKNPQKTMPKAIILAVIFTSVLYVLVAMSAISVLGAEALGASEAPLADVAQKALGEKAHTILAIIALFATANTVLMLQFATSRLVYGMAEKNELNFLSKIHFSRGTPWSAIVVVTLGAIVFMFLGGIETIAYLTDFTIFMAFIAVNLSLIWLRKKQPNLKRGFKVPTLALPALGAASSFLILFTIPSEIIFYGVIIFGIELIIYELFMPKFFDKKGKKKVKTRKKKSRKK